MHSISINDDWICCDHTFKSVTNIGIYQTQSANSAKWIKQFKSLFILLNDVGQILSWQLVPDTSLDTVWDMLKEIKERFQAKGKMLREIYVDDCCKVRNKLQSIFGETTIIKLDLFHAIQRVTRKASKRHSLFSDFISSFKLVFRDPTALGDARLMDTPDPLTLENNLNAFVECWKSVESHDGKKILSCAVLEEINRLRPHIAKGCLSSIKPGRGTNKDESLHKKINSFMKYSKIGTELAYGLLMSSFDTINEQRKQPDNRQSIKAYVTEQMNCVAVDCIIPKFGLTTPPKTICADISENESSSDDDITDTQVSEILNKVKILSQIVEGIKQRGINRAVFNERYLPFMNSAASLFFHRENGKNQDNFESHSNRLAAVVNAWGFEIISSEGDGNCFFYSASVALLQTLDKETSRSVLENLGINDGMSMFEIAQRLREMVVDEWVNNPERYQPFVSTGVVSEARLFLQSGYFMGELGNTMPLALANVLSTPLLLFTSITTVPVLLITLSVIGDAIPRLYLGFNQFGAGHYDAISIRSGENNERPVQLSRNEVSGSILSE